MSRKESGFGRRGRQEMTFLTAENRYQNSLYEIYTKLQFVTHLGSLGIFTYMQVVYIESASR